jgi:hypothetical protein
MPKTSVPATIVKNEKTRRGIDEVGPDFPPEANAAQDRQRDKPGIGDQVDRKQRIRPCAVLLQEQSIGNNAGCHHQREATRI